MAYLSLGMGERSFNFVRNWPYFHGYSKAASVNLMSIAAPTLVNQNDRIQWRDVHGNMADFSVKLAWESLRPRGDVLKTQERGLDHGMLAHLWILWHSQSWLLVRSSSLAVSFEAEATSRQMLAVAEAKIVDLRLSNALKSKHEENGAYLSEIKEEAEAQLDMQVAEEVTHVKMAREFSWCELHHDQDKAFTYFERLVEAAQADRYAGILKEDSHNQEISGKGVMICEENLRRGR
ncbi:hypothetical protein Tco_0218595 [Tanacetum coccineum]